MRGERLLADLLLERLQPEQDRGERLSGLVVELAREALALELLALEQGADGLAPDALGELDREGGAVRERLRDRRSASEKRGSGPCLS